MDEFPRRAFMTMLTVSAFGAVALNKISTTPRPATAHVTPPSASAPILTRDGNKLLIRGEHRRLSGLNAYWLGLNDNDRDTTGAPTMPSHALVTAAFGGMRDVGTSLVRAHTLGISAGTSKSFETEPGVYSDANLDSADWAIYQAKKRSIVLMIPLTDQWNYYHGGKGVFVHWAFQQNGSDLTDVPAPAHLFDADGTEKGSAGEDQFYLTGAGGLRVRALFKDYITHWLNHVNPYTGLAYKDDPTIAVLETGNELYSATSEWTDDIAGFIKTIAPNKLVADGSAATGLAVSNAPGLHSTNIDIVGGHYYAQTSSSTPAPIMTLASQLSIDVSAATAADKAFVIGEYPWTRSDIKSWYSTVEKNDAIAADMTWAFIGGTEVHGGSFGSDDYPVHWPYDGRMEKLHAPDLARHIGSMSSVAISASAAK